MDQPVSAQVSKDDCHGEVDTLEAAPRHTWNIERLCKAAEEKDELEDSSHSERGGLAEFGVHGDGNGGEQPANKEALIKGERGSDG